MTVSTEIREQVRQRAKFACEYCGVTETDAGGLLTVDHYRPRVAGGRDDLPNLLYCCSRCNLHKADYWPAQPEEPMLWNPRQEAIDLHFRLLAEGSLRPLTATGEFALKRLNLNRPQLCSYRLVRLARAEHQQRLSKYQELLATAERLQELQAELWQEQQMVMKQQRTILRLLLDKDG